MVTSCEGGRSKVSFRPSLRDPFREKKTTKDVEKAHPLVRTTSRGRLARFVDLDLALRHLSHLVDLGASLADDTPDEFVRDKDGLRLRARSDGGSHPSSASSSSSSSRGTSSVHGRSGTTTDGATGAIFRPRSVGRVAGRGRVLEQDRADVVDGDVDRVGDARDGQDAFSTAGEHGLARLQPRARRLLNLFDLGAGFADDGTHPRVGDDEAAPGVYCPSV